VKTLGLLGGMSWESTTAYYQGLNRRTRDVMGGQHSAPLLIWSADFAPLSRRLSAGDWPGITGVLADAARRLEAAGAKAVMICSNTMHQVAEPVQSAISVPLIHVADATAKTLSAAGLRRPLLLATRFTMERTFYRDRLAAAGVEAVIPGQSARERLHAIIFDELVQGRFEPGSRADVIGMAETVIHDQAADSIILGCTEFGLLVAGDDFSVPVFDTTDIHVDAGMAFALSDA
jgi:aspartate racemase